MEERLNRRRPLRQGLLACLASVLALILAQPAISFTEPQGKELGDLLRAVSARAEQARTLRMEFTQEKHLSSFDKSIIIRGRTLVDKERGYLVWHVNEPIKYSIIIKDRRVWQWDEHSDKVQEVPVAKLPALDIVLTQMRLLFAGDLVQVGQHYDTEQVSKSPPVIQFTPRDGSPDSMGLKRLSVTIRDDTLDLASILIEDKNGDSTVIKFDKVERNLEFNEDDFSLKDFWRKNKF